MLEARGLAKSYRLYARPADRLLQGLLPGRQRFREVSSLRPLDFELRAGEVAGVVGQNGSGKSTLLKLLAGVLQPTAGSVICHGRLAAMIELGAGFDLTLPGRENARLGAMLMGLSAAEADARLPEIEAFADIGEFFDYPLSTCSSGMLARVAFAVFTCLEPEVLLVDEILAVGDEAFQRKCFARLGALAEAGCAIVIVSHNSQQIIELCDRALLLDHGSCVLEDTPEAVVREYHRLTIGGTSASAAAPEGAPTGRLDPTLVSASQVRYPEAGARILAPRILDAGGREVNVLRRGERYRYCFRVALERAVERLEFGSLLKTVSGTELGGMLHAVTLGAATAPPVTFEIELPFEARLLPGAYFLNAGVRGAGAQEPLAYLHRVVDALMFRIEEETQSVASGIVDFTSEVPPTVRQLPEPGAEA